MYKRLLRLSNSYNVFLFGARGTGKTTFLDTAYDSSVSYRFDLLDVELEDRLSRNPKLIWEIAQALDKKIKYLIFDEIQKVPKLLSLIHQYIQKNPKRFIFVLTGSSARKLKSGGADMLAGRAFVSSLFPLTYQELGKDFNLKDYLSYGGLPQVYTFSSQADKVSYLKAYALTYLKEEVWAEHLIKNLDPFRNFLEVAAQANCQILNYSKIAKLVGVTTKTVQIYFDILKETYIGINLDAFHTSARKRLIQAPKFYFIDPGIKRVLDNTLTSGLVEGTYAFGKAFEHFIVSQLYFLNDYLIKGYKLYYLKTKDGVEIDLIIERPDKKLILVEIKSTTRSDAISITNLKHYKSELKASRAFVLSLDPIERKTDGVEFYQWDKGIEEILR